MVVIPLLFVVALGWNDNLHTSFGSKGNDGIGIIAPVGQQCPRGDSINQVNSFFAISSGTLCDKYSDRHTICIHGKVNFGIEPPFVRLIS